MREIKFRVWDKHIKTFYELDLNDYDRTTEYGEYISSYPDIEISQYTGLKDKNGKEIYEGDIVKSPNVDNAMLVEYDVIQESDDMTAPGIGFQFNTYPEDMEIIGNIYENPDLLEKEPAA